MSSSVKEALKTERISCRFVTNHENYNAGESAVFNSVVAHALKRKGIIEFNEHEVKNDSGMMQLVEGKNQGMDKAEITKLVDRRMDEMEKRLEALIAKMAGGGSESTLPKSSIRKGG